MRYRLWLFLLIAVFALAPTSVASGQSLISLDQPADGDLLKQPVVFSGWALRTDAKIDSGVDAIEIWAYPFADPAVKPFFVGTGKYGLFREEVAKEFGLQFANSGFEATVDGLKSGGYRFIVRARNAETGQFDISTQVIVWIGNGPQMSIDGPLEGSTVGSTFTVMGWAVDTTAFQGTGVDAVQVWATTHVGDLEQVLFLGDASYGLVREDIAKAFGKQFARSGFALDVSTKLAGDWTILVYARSTETGEFDQMRSVKVTISPKLDQARPVIRRFSIGR